VTQDRALWRDDGHLTREAVSAAADGELNASAVQAHLAGCDRCLQAVGQAALLSTQVGEMLASLRREDALRALDVPRPGPRPRRLPPVAVALSAAVVMLAFVTGRWSASGTDSTPPAATSELGLLVSTAAHLRLRAPELAPHAPPARPDCFELELRP
jgi:hypothetical protein